MQYFADDVFLVSYPRSGNTWMRYLLSNILEPCKAWHLRNINEVVPDIYEVDISLFARPRIIKSHEPFTCLYPKVIYMYRDGRDVAASYYNLSKTAFGYKKSFEVFLLAMLTGGKEAVFGSWQAHVSGWLDAAQSGSVFYIKYEDLCQNTVNVMEKLGCFMGNNFDRVMILSAIDKSTFDVQKEHVKKYSEHYVKGFHGGIKGGPGKWREVFTEEMNELFWHHAGVLMTRLGYKKYD
ncbi:MAG: sulfotransferase domain-containing protein [Geobacteraceae bacterium]|nr:sulfotransferase domain-containing protein [Geobacteraceae bacterium]